MRILVFSDGHIGEYPEGWTDAATGLNSRLTDTLNVWSWIRSLACDKKVDVIVFGGDRFKPHRPPHWMRDLADEEIAKFRELDLPLVLLKGNHDMLDKAGRWHSYGGVHVWRGDSKIYVCDKPGILDFKGVNLYMLPFGYATIDYGCVPKGTNILFFHDEVTSLSRFNGQVAKGGIPREVLDREDWSLILGGHIHERQELPFKNTSALHIGTPLERVEDLDKEPKGALLITIQSNDQIELEHIDSPFPKIYRKTYTWDGDIDSILNLITYDPDLTIEEESILVATVNHDGSMTTKDRRGLLTACREKHLSGASIKMNRILQEQKAITMSPTMSKATLAEQMIEWARLNQENDDILRMIETIVEGSR